MVRDDLICFKRRGLLNVQKVYHILNVLSIQNDKNLGSQGAARQRMAALASGKTDAARWSGHRTGLHRLLARAHRLTPTTTPVRGSTKLALV